jgi:hypothetical protein
MQRNRPRNIRVTARGLSHINPTCKITHMGVTMPAKSWAAINPLLGIEPHMYEQDV